MNYIDLYRPLYCMHYIVTTYRLNRDLQANLQLIKRIIYDNSILIISLCITIACNKSFEWVWSIHGSGRAGSGRVGSGRVESGRVPKLGGFSGSDRVMGQHINT